MLGVGLMWLVQTTIWMFILLSDQAGWTDWDRFKPRNLDLDFRTVTVSVGTARTGLRLQRNLFSHGTG